MASSSEVRLLERLLAADPALLVWDVVRPQVLSSLPPGVRERFGILRLRWEDTREVWGLSFDLLTEDSVRVGHVRGHHIGQHPRVHGYTPAQAARIIRAEVEGVLLHELGHALVSLLEIPGVERDWLEDMRRAVALEGAASTYGQGDVHEEAAEAFRWWAMSHAGYERHAPTQARLLAELATTGEGIVREAAAA